MTVLPPSASTGRGSLVQDAPAMRRALLRWHARHARALGFRGTTDPWSVLVSEVMAQQTQVSRVELAWPAFVERFPTAAACAAADRAEVLRAWAGLGYNRRAVHLHRAAQHIVREHGGHVPSDVVLLQALPGVGAYTARAVAAIAFGQPAAAVDTNVRRVVGRLTGRPDATPRALQAAADVLVDPVRPAAWTHALMDLGASVCVARTPHCHACPFAPWCVTRAAEDGAAAAGALQPKRPGRQRPVAFELTRRWLRGRIVESLRPLGRDEWAPLPPAIGGHDEPSIAGAVDALVRDGLVERREDGAVRLASGA